MRSPLHSVRKIPAYLLIMRVRMLRHLRAAAEADENISSKFRINTAN